MESFLLFLSLHQSTLCFLQAAQALCPDTLVRSELESLWPSDEAAGVNN